MKAKIKAQEHRISMLVTDVELIKLQDIDANNVKIKASFICGKYCKNELVVEPIEEGSEETHEVEREVLYPFATPIIYDEIQQVIPYALWDAIRRSINSEQILNAVNSQLLAFAPMFTNSMAGFQLQLEDVRVG